MNSKNRKREDSYYGSSGYYSPSPGNGRTWQGRNENPEIFREDDFVNYDDGYDDNYASPAYTMGSGNFNAGRRNDKDTANMFKPSNHRHWNDADEEGTDYDNNYYREDDDDEHLFGQHKTGRYDRSFLNIRNREGESGHFEEQQRENNYPNYGVSGRISPKEDDHHYSFSGYTGKYILSNGGSNSQADNYRDYARERRRLERERNERRGKRRR
ncbi:MAG: hypothetical protein K0S33_1765 [Bacteroidetes bacterium]|nr:hypothetical protein [Bacteroidota bacterium]